MSMINRRNFLLSTVVLLAVPSLPTLASVGQNDFVNCSLHRIIWPTSDGRISYTVSHDGGQTWSDSEPL